MRALRHLVLGAVLIAGAAPALLAGTIVGQVRAQGATAEQGVDAGGGNYASRRYKFLEKIDYDALRDFVVHIDKVDAPPPAASPPKASVAQRDGAFVPHVLPVVVGTVVEWPNADEIFHNVFCMSETTPFDLGLYKRGDDAKSVVFPHLGRIDVFCSIHTNMNCVVLVLPNPWFARSNDKGRYTIPNVPAGTYQLRAWHERLPAQTTQVVVPAEGEVRVDFVLTPAGVPRPKN